MQKLIRILSGIGFVVFTIMFVVFLSGWWDNDPETTGHFPWKVAVMMIVSGSTCLFGIGDRDTQTKADDNNQ
jgi:hypothetical protein